MNKFTNVLMLSTVALSLAYASKADARSARIYLGSEQTSNSSADASNGIALMSATAGEDINGDKLLTQTQDTDANDGIMLISADSKNPNDEIMLISENPIKVAPKEFRRDNGQSFKINEGWNLIGTGFPIDNMEPFQNSECVSTIYSYADGDWKIMTKDSNEIDVLQSQNGFWIHGTENNCEVKTYEVFDTYGEIYSLEYGKSASVDENFSIKYTAQSSANCPMDTSYFGRSCAQIDIETTGLVKMYEKFTLTEQESVKSVHGYLIEMGDINSSSVNAEEGKSYPIINLRVKKLERK